MMEWERIKHFTEDEMRCKCGCGKAEMNMGFMVQLDQLRDRCGFPLAITSGYRCPEYNAQVSSTGLDGPHTTGKAADIAVRGHQAHAVLRNAMAHFSGIGVAQKGGGRFIHVDTLEPIEASGLRPWVWSY